jgi:type II secretory pathway pseudopilin PulG
MKKPKYPSRSAGAFSLTEVVLALGVMAFGLVGLMGGLSNSLQSQTGAERDTRLAGISQRILSEYRAQSFDLLVAGQDAAGANRVSPCYFTADGEPTAAPAGGARRWAPIIIVKLSG